MELGLPDADLLLAEEEEPPLPLSVAPPEELGAHPGLARLLRELGCVLGPDGLSAPLATALRQAGAGLALGRAAWLRWESLCRGLRELLLLPDPPCLEPPVLRALEQALAPPAGAPPPPLPSPLGARLLPPLEQLLARKTEELGQYHGGGGAAPPLWTQGLETEKRRLRRARRRHRALRRQLERQRRLYPQVLGRCAALLGRLAGEGGAGARAELDGRRADYLEAKGAAILLKIRLEELGVLLDTYPPGKVEAHRRIRAGLEAARERAAGEAGRARAGLAAFGALGPAFQALAEEYGRLRERLANRRWALRQLRPHVP